MEDFNLILKSLISKDLSKVDASALSESMKKEFEKTADVYVKNGNFIDAIKAFALIRNKERLIETGIVCLKNNLPYDAFYAFYYADDKENLNKVGNIFLQIPDVETALKAFKKAENQAMVSFLEENLM